MDVAHAAAGGPELRQLWERARIRPTDLARALGVTPQALRKWSAPGSRTPAGRVDELAAELRAQTRRLDRKRTELLRHIEAAAAAGQGLTRTEVRKQRGAGAEALLDELLDGALPLLHVRQVVKVDELGRTYVRDELHPGAGDDQGAGEEDELDAATLRGLRLYAGWSLAGLAQRIGCRREQLHAWESGQRIPPGRLPKVRAALEQAASRYTLQERRESARLSQAELAAATGFGRSFLGNAEAGHRRGLTWPELAAVGHAIDRIRREEEDRKAAYAEEVCDVITANEPHGITRNQLRLRLGERRGARGVAGGGPTIAERIDEALAALFAARRIEWGATDHVRGGNNALPRLHLAGQGHHYEPLPVADVQARLDAIGASRNQLAERLGLNASSVGEWMRGERDIPPPRVADVRRALDELEQARPDVHQQLLAAAAHSPGLTSRQLAVQAGYGKNNPAAAAALDELVAAGKLHRRPRPRSTGIYPGPAPPPAAGPLPGATLKQLRTAAGLRQRDIADALGVTQTGVARWEQLGLPPHRRAQVEQLLTAAS